METTSSKMDVKDLVYAAICVVIITICSWINIPSAIPFTLQTFAVFFVLEFAGAKRGNISIIVYILLAAVGAPVLAGFKGGIGALLGMTGGYLLGFIFIGLLYRFGISLFGNALPVRVISMILGLFVCYAFGTAWFIVVYTKQAEPISIGAALSMCVIPFIIPDLVKLALAILLASRVKRIVNYSC